jgi:hypothetical protein
MREVGSLLIFIFVILIVVAFAGGSLVTDQKNTNASLQVSLTQVSGTQVYCEFQKSEGIKALDLLSTQQAAAKATDQAQANRQMEGIKATSQVLLANQADEIRATDLAQMSKQVAEIQASDLAQLVQHAEEIKTINQTQVAQVKAEFQSTSQAQDLKYADRIKALETQNVALQTQYSGTISQVGTPTITPGLSTTVAIIRPEPTSTSGGSVSVPVSTINMALGTGMFMILGVFATAILNGNRQNRSKAK